MPYDITTPSTKTDSLVKIKKKKKKSEEVKVKKFIEPIELPKELEHIMDRENKKEFVKYLQQEMKKVEVSIKFDERMNTGGLLSGMSGVTSNPENITYDDINKMRKDYQISAGLAFIKLPVLAQSYSIFCQDPVIKNFVTQTLRPIYRKLMSSTLLGIDYGFSPHEKVFKRENVKIIDEGPDNSIKTKIIYQGDAIIYNKVKSICPDSISILIDELDNFSGMRQETGVKGGVTLKSDECFLFSNDIEFGNYYGKSRLIPTFPLWYYKILLIQFMMKYFERKGSPPLIVNAPPGTSQDTANALHNNFSIALKLGKSLLSNSVGVIPYTESKGGNSQWDIKYLMDDKRGDQFISIIELFDALELRSILVPERTITQDSKGTGSYAMSASHSNMFFLAEDSLIADIEYAINTQIIPQLVSYNFPDAPPCYMIIDRIDLEKKKMLNGLMITIFNKMDTFIKEYGKSPFDVFPSLNKMGEILGLPMEKIKLYDFGEGDNLIKRREKKDKVDDAVSEKIKEKIINKEIKNEDAVTEVERLIEEFENMPVPINR